MHIFKSHLKKTKLDEIGVLVEIKLKLHHVIAGCAWALLFTTAAFAAEMSISGFGTIGFAQSDENFTYQRYVSRSGTLRRDSLAGIQFDATFADHFGATVQLLAAPSSSNDKRYDGNFSWAFLSWRPTNNLQIRVGRQRIPLYLHSQNYDVGVTYEFARLPTEMYSIAPGNEFNGISFSRYWNRSNGDLTLDGYWGSTDLNSRYWFRDGVPSIQSAGASFRKIYLSGAGLVLSYKTDENSLRIGLHSASGKQNDDLPLPATFPFVSLLPGVGYFQVDNSLPGPGIPRINSIRNTIATIGADISLSHDFRMMGEYAITLVNNPSAKIANASKRGYVSLLRKVDKWTPYVTYAFLRSDADQLALYQRVNGNSVPSAVPGFALINASQRAGADAMLTYDQHSVAIGTSYSLSPTSKIKAIKNSVSGNIACHGIRTEVRIGSISKSITRMIKLKSSCNSIRTENHS